jgi:predicted transcriptional regulator
MDGSPHIRFDIVYDIDMKNAECGGVMTAISMNLPDELAVQSSSMAKQLGMSRTAFIRQALQHELQRVERQQDEAAIAADLRRLADNRTYMAESEAIEAGFNDLPEDDAECWWTTRDD